MEKHHQAHVAMSGFCGANPAPALKSSFQSHLCASAPLRGPLAPWVMEHSKRPVSHLFPNILSINTALRGIQVEKKRSFSSSLTVRLLSTVEVSPWDLVQLRRLGFSQGFPTRPGQLLNISFLVKVSLWGVIEVSLRGLVKVSLWGLGRLSNISFFVKASPWGLTEVWPEAWSRFLHTTWSALKHLIFSRGFFTRPGQALRDRVFSQGFSTRPGPALKHLIFSQGFSIRPGCALRHLIFRGIWELKLQVKFVADQPSSVPQSPQPDVKVQRGWFFVWWVQCCVGDKEINPTLTVLRWMDWGGYWNMVCTLLWVLYLWEIFSLGSIGTQKSLLSKFGAVGPHCS